MSKHSKKVHLPDVNTHIR